MSICRLLLTLFLAAWLSQAGAFATPAAPALAAAAAVSVAINDNDAPLDLQAGDAVKNQSFGTAIQGAGRARYARPIGYALLAALLLLLLVLLVLWNEALRRQVKEKTASLAESVEALRQQQVSEKRLDEIKAIASRVPGVVYQYLLRPDGSSHFLYASEAIQDFFRVNLKQVLQDAATAFAVMHPDDLADVVQSIHDSAANLTPWQKEFRLKFDDGTVRWVFGNSLPTRLADGGTLWHGFIGDVTVSRAADEKLRQLSRAIEQAPIAIVITDLNGSIDYVNPWFTQITGYALDEVQGKTPKFLQSGCTAPQAYVDLWNTLCADHVWHGELHNRKKNGELFIEQAVIAPVLDASGHATHYVAVKQDISQRKQAEQALQQSLQEKVALLNEVHHRVKNNLQVITSLLRLEAARSAQPDTKAVLKDMQGRIYAMALLHESLYRAGNFASIDLATYLKQLAMQAFRAQSSDSAAVRLVLELAAVDVILDQATPCGLLVNELISNALKHGFPDGRVGEVRVVLQPGPLASSWQLTVCDTGVGLPDDFLARRAQSLGLQLVADLARQLGGTLEIEPGPGANFKVTFPVQAPAH